MKGGFEPATLESQVEHSTTEPKPLLNAIKRLAVHNENTQEVYFKGGRENEILNKKVESTLRAYFKLNQIDSEASNYLYSETPIHYTFDEKLKTWNRRKKTKKPYIK